MCDWRRAHAITHGRMHTHTRTRAHASARGRLGRSHCGHCGNTAVNQRNQLWRQFGEPHTPTPHANPTRQPAGEHQTAWRRVTERRNQHRAHQWPLLRCRLSVVREGSVSVAFQPRTCIYMIEGSNISDLQVVKMNSGQEIV